MKNILMVLTIVLLASGCAGVLEKQESVCSGTALIGGQEATVQIYSVRQVGSQTQYKAGDPFGWRWVSKANFISTTCDK
ncbi:phage exclusion lipoprotein Cor [Rahnella victoriana]|uniref:phage exclusion lipoprotein Cor n=1 Tax=Rahnella victoriana TaxID=1510570 RepID=UPI000E6B6ECE|nr:cor protein [Rahnella victoriana]UHM89867.1 cor protein [Rahnella victoriana]